jgi:hypothetical protein
MIHLNKNHPVMHHDIKLVMRTCRTHKTSIQQKHLIIMHHLHVKLPQFAKSARSSWLLYPTKTTFTNKNGPHQIPERSLAHTVSIMNPTFL